MHSSPGIQCHIHLRPFLTKIRPRSELFATRCELLTTRSEVSSLATRSRRVARTKSCEYIPSHVAAMLLKIKAVLVCLGDRNREVSLNSTQDRCHQVRVTPILMTSPGVSTFQLPQRRTSPVKETRTPPSHTIAFFWTLDNLTSSLTS